MRSLSHLFSALLIFSSSLVGAPTIKKCINGKFYVNMHLGGRLGNQMFQVAAAVSLAEDFGAQAIFPDFNWRKEEDGPLNHKTLFPSLLTVSPPLPPSYSFSEHPHFHYAPIPYHPNMEISGYFQSEKYFERHKEKICQLFEPSDAIKNYLYKNYAALIDHPNTVAIHMRAYKLESPDIENCFPFLSGKYFMKAAERFAKDALFVIFSDKIEWAKTELKDFNRPHLFIEKENQFNDLYLMSFCKHQIISPSSFSWWAAYLNKNPNKVVIAPYPWFSPISGHDSTNVLPPEWQKMAWIGKGY